MTRVGDVRVLKAALQKYPPHSVFAPIQVSEKARKIPYCLEKAP